MDTFWITIMYSVVLPTLQVDVGWAKDSDPWVSTYSTARRTWRNYKFPVDYRTLIKITRQKYIQKTFTSSNVDFGSSCQNTAKISFFLCDR